MALKIRKKNCRKLTRNWALSFRRMVTAAKRKPSPRSPEIVRARTAKAKAMFSAGRPPTRRLTMTTAATDMAAVHERMAKMRETRFANLLAGER